MIFQGRKNSKGSSKSSLRKPLPICCLRGKQTNINKISNKQKILIFITLDLLFIMEQTCENWDQRIPNESIFNRNFLIKHPPLTYLHYPQTTNQCIKSSPVVSTSDTKQLNQHWSEYLNGQDIQGLPTNSNTIPALNLSSNSSSNSNKGRPINIDAESTLKGLNYFNPKDVIQWQIQQKLSQLNDYRVQKLIPIVNSVATPAVFNNATRIRNIDCERYY